MNERIKQLRLAVGLSQDEFARRMGFETRGAITNLEKGKTEPKPQFINRLVKEFGVSLEWLETGEGEMFQPKSAADELTDYVAKVTGTEPNDIQRRFIHAMAQLDPEEWKVIEKFIDAINN